MRIITLLAAIAMATSCFAQLGSTDDEQKKTIASIKKSDKYLYSEITATTMEEAKAAAEEMLYEEINRWAATQKRLRNADQVVVKDRKEVWSEIALPRGNMFRSFMYVKKSDLMPADNLEVMDRTSTTATTLEQIASPLDGYPDFVGEIAAIKAYDQLVAKLKSLAAQGRVGSYARYAKLSDPSAYFLSVYNRAGEVVALLSPGAERTNLVTGKADSEKNYPGHGALGFTINK